MNQTPFDPHHPNADPTIPVNTPTAVNGQIAIVDYDPAWPAMFQREADRIRAALGDRALRVEYMGSTAVPGLPAKPCIDILLVVQDSADEPSYVPELEAAGYVLRIRQPEWNEHRVFKGSEINLNLHVWSEGSAEIDRHLAFRDWLRAHEDDRDLYAATKRELAARHWTLVQDYAEAKNEVVTEIQNRGIAPMSREDLIPIGPIVRLQVQINPLKVGTRLAERYDPGNIRQVPALEIGPHGVIGLDPDRDHALADVHNRDHPLSRFRGENGVSIGFTSHYRAMRDRFGAHLVDGLAGENILVACDDSIMLEDIASGLVIGEGEDAVIVDEWVVARPCAPFTKFALGLAHDQKPDRRVTEGLQFLDDGTRGFYGRYHDQRPGPAVIWPGAMVYRRR